MFIQFNEDQSFEVGCEPAGVWYRIKDLKKKTDLYGFISEDSIRKLAVVMEQISNKVISDELSQPIWKDR